MRGFEFLIWRINDKNELFFPFRGRTVFFGLLFSPSNCILDETLIYIVKSGGIKTLA